MVPLLLVGAGLGALVAAWLVLRSFGPRFRVGRLLASTPTATVDEARALAERGERRYVRVHGRIDSEDEFEDPDHRPLVFRRTRLDARGRGGWSTFEDSREQVAFEVREGLAGIGVDAAALDAGLVVVPRISFGVADDLGDRAPGDLAGTTPVRATIEQVSSVEHAIVLGVPIVDDGGVRLTAGLGRPLVLTTLEPSDAMRILTGGSTRLARVATALLITGGLLVAAGVAVGPRGGRDMSGHRRCAAAVLTGLFLMALLVGTVAAATPDPTQALGGDPRSSGEGPGLVGQPVIAIVAVVAIGLAAAAVTILYVRLTDRTRRDR